MGNWREKADSDIFGRVCFLGACFKSQLVILSTVARHYSSLNELNRFISGNFEGSDRFPR